MASQNAHGGIRRLIIICAVGAMLIASGVLMLCGAFEGDKKQEQLPVKTTQAPGGMFRKALNVTTQEVQFDGVGAYVMYPMVQGGYTDGTINSAIELKVRAFAKTYYLAESFDFTVTNNDNGIFSFVLYAYVEEAPEFLTMTFDVDTGTELSLHLLMDESKDYGGAFAKLVEEKANKKKLLLLKGIPEVSKEHSYYVTPDGITLIYRVYEISIYAAKNPSFLLEWDEVGEYLGENSPVKRLMEAAN